MWFFSVITNDLELQNFITYVRGYLPCLRRLHHYQSVYLPWFVFHVSPQNSTPSPELTPAAAIFDLDGRNYPRHHKKKQKHAQEDGELSDLSVKIFMRREQIVLGDL